MIAKQLSIFLENRKGRFTEIAKLLGEHDINMTAFTVSENSDFGILRVIVSDTEKAINILREQEYAVNITEVACIQTPNQPGALAKVLEFINTGGVFIEYMYAFSEGNIANVIVRPDNMELCINQLKKHKVDLLAASDLYKL